MNKIVFIARVAKGLTEKQMAGKLKIAEDEYKEWELGIKDMTDEFAMQLEKVHKVPADYFLTYDVHNIRNCINALEKQKELFPVQIYRMFLFLHKRIFLLPNWG